MKHMKKMKCCVSDLQVLHALHGDQCIGDSGTYCGKQEKLTMKLMKTMKFFFFKFFMPFMVKLPFFVLFIAIPHAFHGE
ncbi:MAG: hypothetical protein RB296_01010 [Acidobacteriota bacterium]|jgi:hypothetical protein|nr:hypothetical protein [Acidobacteriota bacterium]